VLDIMVFLHSHGVGTARAVRIFGTYGHDAIQVMTENPYRLARDIRGIGFRTAEAIAMKLGMTKEAPQRVRAGVSFALQEATDDGHCALPNEDLVKLAVDLLEVDEAIVRRALDQELGEGEVVADMIDKRPCIFLRGFYFAERGIADRLKGLAAGSPPWPAIDAEKAIPWVEGKTGKTLAPSQRAAVKMVLQAKAAVLTGGPGVGETTLLDDILRILAAKGVKLLLAAPALPVARLTDVFRQAAESRIDMTDRIERFGSSFAPGDKVMQTENDYDREVFNGDLGRVLRIDQTEGVLVPILMAGRLSIPLASSMRLCLPMRRRSTSRKGLNIPPW
jgi:ATP-dependent exoDNAse (exonuclease V) alpha subunit